MNGNNVLILAAAFSFIAGLLHVAIIIGGASWYRFFGAGERMAKLAESGNKRATFVTSGIALLLGIWGLYALSGANVIVRLPLLNYALFAITAVYLIRGTVGLILPFIFDHPQIAQNSIRFWLISSILCLVIGLFHLSGVILNWEQLMSHV